MSQLISLLRSDEFTQSIAARSTLSEKDIIRFARMFESALNKNPALLRCTQKSIMITAQALAENNLSPIPAHGQAYLIPYGDECQLQIGWRGHIFMAINSGAAKSIRAGVVYEGDHFFYDNGVNVVFDHRPNMTADHSQENILCFYAIATLPNGEKIIEVMTKQDIDEIRRKFHKPSKRGLPSPWDTSYAEMGRKTVVKRICKYLPSTIRVLEAIALDNASECNLEKDITPREEAKSLSDRIKENLGTSLDVAEDGTLQLSEDDFFEDSSDEPEPMQAAQEVAERVVTPPAEIKSFFPEPPPLGEAKPSADIGTKPSLMPKPAKDKPQLRWGNHKADLIAALGKAMEEKLIKSQYMGKMLYNYKVKDINELTDNDASVELRKIEDLFDSLYSGE